MTEQTKTAVDAMDKVESWATAISAKIGALIEQAGQPVYETAMAVARVDAAQTLIDGLFALTIWGLAGWFFYAVGKMGHAEHIARVENMRIAVKEGKMYEPHESKIETPSEVYVVKGIAIALWTIGGFHSTHYLTKVAAWVGVFHPEVWLAYKAIQGIGG